MKVLVIAAHPDDEVLGMGATIRKLAKKKAQIHLCVVSEGASAQYKDKKMIAIRKEACIKSGQILGISGFDFLGFPDMKLDTIPHLDINMKIEDIIKTQKPEIVYTTPPNDLNMDHRVVFDSTLVATRPLESTVRSILCYEIPAVSRIPFYPTVYENITKELPFKIRAFKKYKSEVKDFPHARSIESIESLAMYRGMESGLRRAEAFQLVKSIID